MVEPTNVVLVAPPSLSKGLALQILFPEARRIDGGVSIHTENNLCIRDVSELDRHCFNLAILTAKADTLVLIIDAVTGLGVRDYWTKILSSLGAVPKIVLAIDNMAGGGWSQKQFEQLKGDFTKQASEFSFSEIHAVPVNFQTQEMVRTIGGKAKWYQGQTLLDIIQKSTDENHAPGIKIEPEEADQLAAHICWLHEEPMLPSRHYELRTPKAKMDASISDLKFKISSQAQYQRAAKELHRGEIGYVNVSLDEAIEFSPFELNRNSGYFELFDKLSGEIAGYCIIKHGLRRATNIKWQQMEVDKSARAKAMGQTPCILWFTGLSGSGKSTIASLVEKKLHQKGLFTYALDGDNVRHGLCRDLGFTDADRVENLRRISETAKLFVDAGMLVLASFISPFKSERQEARELFEKHEFLEIYVDTPLDVCEIRDPKGLYKLARAGELKNFTGLDSPYEAPENAEIRLAGAELSPDKLADQVLDELERRGLI